MINLTEEEKEILQQLTGKPIKELLPIMDNQDGIVLQQLICKTLWIAAGQKSPKLQKAQRALELDLSVWRTD